MNKTKDNHKFEFTSSHDIKKSFPSISTHINKHGYVILSMNEISKDIFIQTMKLLLQILRKFSFQTRLLLL